MALNLSVNFKPACQKNNQKYLIDVNEFGKIGWLDREKSTH